MVTADVGKFMERRILRRASYRKDTSSASPKRRRNEGAISAQGRIFEIVPTRHVVGMRVRRLIPGGRVSVGCDLVVHNPQISASRDDGGAGILFRRDFLRRGPRSCGEMKHESR